MVESMVALFVLVSGVVILLQIFPLGFSAERANQMRTQAIFLAQEKTEALIASNYDNIVVGDFLEQPLPEPFTLFSRRTKTTYVNKDLQTIVADDGLKKIEVVVFWSPALSLGKKEVQIITLVSR